MSCQDAGISLLCIFWMRQGLVWLLVCCRDNTVAALWLSQVGNRISSPKIICLTVRACWVPDGPCIRRSPLSQCCFSPGPQMSLDTTRCTCWWLLASHSTLHHPPDTSHGKAPVSPSPAQATSGMTQICVLMEELLPKHLDGFPVPSSLLLHCRSLQLCAVAKSSTGIQFRADVL